VLDRGYADFGEFPSGQCYGKGGDRIHLLAATIAPVKRGKAPRSLGHHGRHTPAGSWAEPLDSAASPGFVMCRANASGTHSWVAAVTSPSTSSRCFSPGPRAMVARWSTVLCACSIGFFAQRQHGRAQRSHPPDPEKRQRARSAFLGELKTDHVLIESLTLCRDR